MSLEWVSGLLSGIVLGVGMAPLLMNRTRYPGRWLWWAIRREL